MRKLLLTGAVVAASAAMTLGSAPAGAGPFCATYPDGGTKSCNFYSYAACARAINGAGGQCSANTRYDEGFGGYADSYAYVPGPAYGTGGPRYYSRPGIEVYIGGSID